MPSTTVTGRPRAFERAQIFIGRAEEDLTETQIRPAVGNKSLQRPQESAVAHAVEKPMEPGL